MTATTSDAMLGRLSRASRTVAGELFALRRQDVGPTSAARWWFAAPAVVVVLGLGALDLVQHYDVGLPAAMGLSCLRAAPLVFLPRWPLASWWALVAAGVGTAAVVQPTSESEPWPWAVSTALALAVALAVLTPRVRRATACALWASVQIVGLAMWGFGIGYGESLVISLVGTAVATGLAVVGGWLVAAKNAAEQRLVFAQRQSRAERDRSLLLEERARVARDLHDVVAHHMSVITVQADSAGHRLADLHTDAREEFASIAGSARAALGEMRRVLDVLRSDSEMTRTAYAPQAELASLPDLVANVRRAGVEVRLDAEEPPRRLSPQLELTAYRVVQEALSNVVRHAPEASATVRVHQSQGALRIEVTNTAACASGVVESSHAAGGLAGMADRVGALGGWLRAAPLEGGGFRLEASLPVAGSTS